MQVNQSIPAPFRRGCDRSAIGLGGRGGGGLILSWRDLTRDSDDIFRVASTDLTEQIPLHVPLVIGERAAALIDSGVRPMFGQLREMIHAAGVGSAWERGGLRWIVHTHSHHDHIGCNARVQDAFGSLIAGPGHYAVWHEDFERHFQQFARPFPDMVPDTPELRAEVLDILDEPRPLDVHLSAGDVIDLGGGVRLEAVDAPGHMLAELAYVEPSTSTLILGDAITGLDWPIFHSHLDVAAYRLTLDRLADLIPQRGIRSVQAAHFGRLRPAETLGLIERARSYLDEVEVAVLRQLAGAPRVLLEQVWTGVCESMGRVREFRALNMVQAHLTDLESRGLCRSVGHGGFELR